MAGKRKREPIHNLVIVSDLHCGCRLGLCTQEKVWLTDGGCYIPSEFQRIVAGWWSEFWDEAVPRICRGEPFAVVVNGELVDGVHHKATSQVSHNLEDQKRIAVAALEPIVAACDGRFYVISGTPAHSGESGCDDEGVARTLGAIPDETGRHARYTGWFRVGRALVNVSHHVGVTGVSHYETSAPFKELVEAFVEAGRWGDEPPDFVVRSHRHRFIAATVPTHRGLAAALVTPGWQGKTPFAYRVPGGRQTEPQFGGVVIRQGDEEAYFREWVRRISRPRTVLP